jgi:hypothetical protein
MKFPRHTKHRQKSSKRTPSWRWSPKRWPPICLSNTTTEVKETTERKISPHGGNHFSKRRSDDSENNNKSRNVSQTKDSKSKSESESKNKKRESDHKDIKTMMTDSKTKEVKRLQHNVTVKADKVKSKKDQNTK